ncbi:MAG: rhodanese-like domain-containing protein [Acidimicrobiales bacterium]|nr:rhodanese-like domain-containing protein [Acidimicrobiales bacterium]MCB9392974.1 rhodanese-like domain-containing protein [Acidimicrobiaceae bacterium]
MNASRRSSARPRRLAAGVLALGVVALAGCGDDETAASAAAPTTAAAPAGAPAAASPALVGASAFQSLVADPPAGSIVLDVRTPEEFDAGHIAGATMIDFQAPTFVEQVSELDRDAPIFLYCRSGNRSAQAVAQMVGLGFTDITELDGGIISWEAASLPLVTG